MNELNILKGNLQYGERSAEVRRELERREREREQALLLQLDRAEKEKTLLDLEHQEDQRISEEIATIKRDEERQERERQRVREESEELRALRQKLRAAEMNFQRRSAASLSIFHAVPPFHNSNKSERNRNHHRFVSIISLVHSLITLAPSCLSFFHFTFTLFLPSFSDASDSVSNLRRKRSWKRDRRSTTRRKNR